MRTLPAMSTVLLLILCSACVAAPDDAASRTNHPLGNGGESAATDGPASTPKEALTLNGTIRAEGSGDIAHGLAGSKILAVAKTVSIMSLGANGELVPVAETTVQPGGTFTVQLSPSMSPTEIFVMKVKDLGGAIVGSGVVNGIPAFFKGFVVDATVDTATSFKTEILQTIAKKGVPGVQNYLNVVDAYVDAQLASSIAVVTVVASDLDTLIGATSDAVIAAENVIVDSLQKAGIPIDISALQNAQTAAMAGLQGLVKNAAGTYVTTSKNLVASLQAAGAAAAKPIDDAIFNAIVNGGAAFSNAFKNSASGKPGIPFAATQSAFGLQTAISTASIIDSFTKNSGSAKVLAAVQDACTKLTAAVQSAQNPADLEAAKAAFTDALLGQNASTGSGILELLEKVVADLTALCNGVHAWMKPWTDELRAAFESWDWQNCWYKLQQFDDSAHNNLPAKLKGALSDQDAESMSTALRLVQKQVSQ